MNILGIYGAFDWDANKFWHPSRINYTTWIHDAGATLFCNGDHIHSISEERLTGIKYDGNYPINSIKQCLDIGGISEVDIDVVCIPTQCIEIFYEQLDMGIVEGIIKQKFPNASVEIYSHHLCHAASSVFTSNFNDGVIITLDGAGSLALDLHNRVFEHECNTIGYFDKSKKQFNLFVGDRMVNRFGDYYRRNSFKAYVAKQNIPEENWDDIIPESVDGKVMGLSSYGKVNKIQRYKKSDKSWGGVPYIMFDHDNIDTSLSPEDLAATCQKTFEASMLDYIKMLSESDYLKPNVCFAGGAFLNVLSNTNIIRSSIFDNVHIPPFTNDTGLNFGAAAYHAFKHGFDIKVPNNIALLGKKYSNEEIKSEINKHQVNVTYYEHSEVLFKEVANKLEEDKIVAWFQNRSEAGPRALGARSILMSARKKEHKDILNSRVKHREYWRPFAGIILKEYVDEYFEDSFETPYMLYSLTVKEDKRGVIPAITHEDNSCRIQTVTYEQNPEVTQLITEYQKLSGVPVILNTSFNDNGKPIVDSPKDAIEAFLKMDIDVLAIGNYLITKEIK